MWEICKYGSVRGCLRNEAVYSIHNLKAGGCGSFFVRNIAQEHRLKCGAGEKLYDKWLRLAIFKYRYLGGEDQTAVKVCCNFLYRIGSTHQITAAAY